jgi:hypothetical protein
MLSGSQHGPGGAGAAHFDATMFDLDSLQVPAIDGDVESGAAYLYLSVARAHAKALALTERRHLYMDGARLENDQLVRCSAHSREVRTCGRGDRAVITRDRASTGRPPEANREHGAGSQCQAHE